MFTGLVLCAQLNVHHFRSNLPRLAASLPRRFALTSLLSRPRTWQDGTTADCFLLIFEFEASQGRNSCLQGEDRGVLAAHSFLYSMFYVYSRPWALSAGQSELFEKHKTFGRHLGSPTSL